MTIAKLISEVKNYFSQPANRLFAAAAALLIVIALIKDTFDSNDRTDQPAQDSDTLIDPRVDTVIPSGFVLIPIEISNLEALDSLIGRYAIVDLFSAPNLSQRSKKVADNVRLLRAPLNPSQFAVLIADSESELFFANDGPYRVVIQNPDKNEETKVTQNKPKPASNILYLGDK